MYNILNNSCITPKAQTKYTSKGLTYDCNTWRNSMLFKCTKDTTLFMVSIWILATKTFLYMIHYVDSNKYSFCQAFPEFIQH